MAKIVIKNIDRLINKFNNIANLDITDVVKDATKLVHAQAKALAQADTGNLRGSIHMDVKKKTDSIEGRVYTNLEYAPYVEFGTGTKGNGTYPYKVEGLTLTYKNKGWAYWDEENKEWIYTKGQVAQPYMYPALKRNEKTIEKMIKDGLRDDLAKTCKGGR